MRVIASGEMRFYCGFPRHVISMILKRQLFSGFWICYHIQTNWKICQSQMKCDQSRQEHVHVWNFDSTFEVHFWKKCVSVRFKFFCSEFAKLFKRLFKICSINNLRNSKLNHSFLFVEWMNKWRKMKLQLFMLCCALQAIHSLNVSDYISKWRCYHQG